MLICCTGPKIFGLNTFIERRARSNYRFAEDSESDCAFESSAAGGSGVQITLFSICVWSVSLVSAKFSCVWIYAWSALFSSVKPLLNFSVWIRAWSVPSVCNQSFISMWKSLFGNFIFWRVCFGKEFFLLYIFSEAFFRRFIPADVEDFVSETFWFCFFRFFVSGKGLFFAV